MTAITWRSFPGEIRLLILDLMARGHRESSEPHARAGYAVVCKDWQVFWEKETFKRLILDQSRLSDLDRIVRRNSTSRLDHVEHLWLCIDLEEYDCGVCHLLEDDHAIRRNNSIFTDALWTLLEIISQWTRGSDSRNRQLVLELGACSPSDSKHDFRDFRLQKDYPYLAEEDIEKEFNAYRQQKERQSEKDDIFHSWIDYQRQNRIGYWSKKRLLGTEPLKLIRKWPSRWQQFPRVDIVTGLLLRRQYYRIISPKVFSKLLKESLTRLTWFRHERWRDVRPLDQLHYENAYAAFISTGLPETLSQLSLFEDYNYDLHGGIERTHGNLDLARAISRRSRKLEKLSAAFFIDAREFYSDFWPGLGQILDPNLQDCWTNLKSLALTSRELHPNLPQSQPNQLLTAAGTAASFMPKLETLEIWNAGLLHASLFRYSTKDRSPKITWRSNWEVDLWIQTEVVSSWKEAARRHDKGDLEVIISPLELQRPRDRVGSFGEVLRLLGLKLDLDVLHPVSSYQIFYERVWRTRG